MASNPAAFKARRERLKATGLCVNCRKPATQTLCDKCREERSTKRKAKYGSRKRTKRCPRCVNPVDSGEVFCPTCRKVSREEMRRYKDIAPSNYRKD